MPDNKERTFLMIKPDGVQRGLVGKIIQRFEEKGFKLVAMKMVWVSHKIFASPRIHLIPCKFYSWSTWLGLTCFSVFKRENVF